MEMEEEEAPNEEMEEVAPWDEEKEKGEVDLASKQAEFGLQDALEEFKVGQAEKAAGQHAILEFIQSEAEVAANCRFLHEVEMEREQLFMDGVDASEFRPVAVTMRPMAPARTPLR